MKKKDFESEKKDFRTFTLPVKTSNGEEGEIFSRCKRKLCNTYV